MYNQGTPQFGTRSVFNITIISLDNELAITMANKSDKISQNRSGNLAVQQGKASAETISERIKSYNIVEK